MSATERLSNLDEFGSRSQIFPADVKGRFRTWRTRVNFVLLAVFVLLPWLKINGLQTVLLDVPNRRFEIFGQLFLAHDTPLIFFILIFLVLSLAIATALWGRVWCGWACPQTVFIDAVYRRVEQWVEGSYIERRKRYAAPMTFSKFSIYTVKWFLFLLVSSLFAHSFIAYFTGSDRLIEMIQGPPAENWSYFVIVSCVTALLLFDFGWFREQFCIIMCPYGRIQSVLMDKRSLTIHYDVERGEPRKGLGDCVACNRCVQVCPTGIDIRNGVQMECIACTACIDACDEIMTKVGKPTGLIRYHREPVKNKGWRYIRPRMALYVTLAALSLVGLGYSLSTRAPFWVAIMRAKDVPYQMVQDEMILNHFKAHLMNQSLSEQEFEIKLPPDLEAQGVKITQAQPTTKLKAGGSAEVHMFILFPKSVFNAHGEARLKLHVKETTTGAEQDLDVIAVGPNNGQARYSSGGS